MAENRPEKRSTPTGQYYLMEKIAQGGMAEIFKGLSYDVHGLKKTVCIKKILPHISASQEFIDSLIDEAKIAVKLVHGNIAQTFDLGKVGDDYFMVMEFVDGKSLSQIHKRCQTEGRLIPIEHLIYFMAETLGGLDYIHRRTDDDGVPINIVHRDISPQNIMVSYSGTVKIIDFGIAKTTVKIGATDSGILKGKFAYMSPEQAYGDAIDNRSDIFSLGIIFHEMLTGARLFKAEDSRQTIRNVRKAKITVPSQLRSDIEEELDIIVLKALAKDRRRRFSSAAEMRDELLKFLYSRFQNFKPSDAADFVRDLFKDEMSAPSIVEVDAKTPHMIIDRSNSALADDSQFEETGIARAPLDMQEYMLDEDKEISSSDKSDHGDEQVLADSEEIDELPPKENQPIQKDTPQTIEAEDSAFHIQPRIGKRYGPAIISALILLIVLLLPDTKRNTKISETGNIAPPEKVMEQVEAQKPAELVLNITPADADITLDNKGGYTGSPIFLKGIEPGIEHILVIRKVGFAPHERQFTLKPGQVQNMRINLSPNLPRDVHLEVTSTPAGATIFIDDIETKYRTPAKIGNLVAGKEYSVGIYLQKYKYWTKKVALKAGENRSIDIQLGKDLSSILIDSVPQNARVAIDGVPSGFTPLKRDGLEPDQIFNITIELDEYEPISKEIKTSPGRLEELRIDLIRKPTEAEIEASSRSDAKRGSTRRDGINEPLRQKVQ